MELIDSHRAMLAKMKVTSAVLKGAFSAANPDFNRLATLEVVRAAQALKIPSMRDYVSDLRVVLKTREGTHEVIHWIPNPASARRVALSKAKMTVLFEGLQFFLYDTDAFRATCRNVISTLYAEEELKKGNVLFIVDVAGMGSTFDFDRVRGFLCFETMTPPRKRLGLATSTRNRQQMHVSLVCVKPRTEAEGGVRVYGLATGDTLMAVATVFAQHIRCSEMYLEAIEPTIGYYQRFGFQYRSSCRHDYFIVDLPDTLKRQAVASDAPDMVAFRKVLVDHGIKNLTLRKCLVNKGNLREHILQDDVRMKAASVLPADTSADARAASAKAKANAAATAASVHKYFSSSASASASASASSRRLVGAHQTWAESE